MSRSVFVFCCTLLTCVAPCSLGQEVSRAYCGKDGKAHVLYRDGTAKTFEAEKKQVGCGEVAVAADGHTVGWPVMVENCCTSYPIPTSIVVYSGRKRTLISVGMMVHQWRFVNGGRRVSVLSGPVHGEAAEADLYDTDTGKVIDTWGGSGKAPDWAADWKQQFADPE